MKKLPQLWQLYYTFFRIGGFTFGGGYAMLPIIEKEVVDIKKWVKEEEMIDYLSLASSVPGAIAINTSTLVGYRVAGVPGALVATAGMVSPSLIIIILIASMFMEFQQLEVVQKAFGGIRAAVVAMILMAVIKMGKSAIKDWIGILIAICAVLVILIIQISPIWVILTSICLGIALRYRGEQKQ